METNFVVAGLDRDLADDIRYVISTSRVSTLFRLQSTVYSRPCVPRQLHLSSIYLADDSQYSEDEILFFFLILIKTLASPEV